MDKLTGILKHVIFESKENNYQIVSFLSDGYDYIICGYFQPLIKDVIYDIEGTFTQHPKHGEQLNVSSVKKSVDTSYQGIIDYLSSNFFPGVGEKYAIEVYEKLGANCLDLIIEDKTILDKTNLSNKIKDVLYNGLIQNKSLEELFVKMYDSGLTTKNIMKLYEKHQDRTLNYIYNDPYNLIYELDMFGFKKADSLAIKLGFDMFDNKRIRALLIYILFSLTDNFGMSYIDKELLYNEVNKYNNVVMSVELFDKNINTLIANNKIFIESNNVYLKHIYEAEINLSNKIKEINNKKTKYKEKNILEGIANYQFQNNIEFSSDQIDAIKNSLLNKMSIITGGPGTGKTTIVKAIIEIYCMLNSFNIVDDKAHLDIKLLAPTGKAAKRLREKCNFPAETIHRALGYDFEGNFMFDEYNLLPSQLIVIDEVSMIDLSLANNLFNAISNKVIVVFVGDHNQLPSISCGEVLNDLIISNTINVSVLDTIYRQKYNSGIVNLASMINNGIINADVFHENNDLHFIQCKETEVNDFVVRYIKKAITQGYDLNEDITILAPMYKGVSGIDNINTLISDTYNLDFDFSFEHKEKVFKQNDKIIQLVNSKELQIYNGDIGVIDNKVLIQTETKDVEKINIAFDNKFVKLNYSEFENVKLAYATSIHKSQGSEYKVVIMPITKAHTIMLKRKLLYTGVTRAKEKLVIIGDYNTFLKGVSRVEDKRQSTLAYRLNNEINQNLKLINNIEIPFETLGETNMEGITPYSFM